MITKIEGNCSFEGCDKPATYIAAKGCDFPRFETSEVKCYCEKHANEVSSTLEYQTVCPNCQCMFGV